MASLGLFQNIQQMNENGYTLDLCFSRNPDNGSALSVDPLKKLDLPHHLAFVCDAYSTTMTTFHKQLSFENFYYDFANADYDSINDHFDKVDLDFITGTTSLDLAHKSLISLIHDTIDKFVPLKLSKSTTHPPWFNSELINLTNKKSVYTKNTNRQALPLLNVILNYVELNVSVYRAFVI